MAVLPYFDVTKEEISRGPALEESEGILQDFNGFDTEISFYERLKDEIESWECMLWYR